METKLTKREAFIQNSISLREREGEPLKDIEGVAIVVNAETVLYEGSDWREVEVIDPACISAEFIATQDIKLNLLHERNASIARNNKGQGSLQLATEKDGLHFSTPIPDCDLGKRAAALISNGTYTGCSFEFYPKDYEVSERVGKDGKTEYLIRHKAFERITALTLGMDPAYEQTSLGLREIIDSDGEDTEDIAKREAELKAEAEAKAKREKETRDAKIAALRAQFNSEL